MVLAFVQSINNGFYFQIKGYRNHNTAPSRLELEPLQQQYAIISATTTREEMDESNNNEGVEVEAPPTCRFFGAAENSNSKGDSIDQLPNTDDDDIESDWGAPSANQQGKQPNTCSNIKFYLLLLATLAIFLGVGIGEYGIVYCNHRSSRHRVDTDYGDISAQTIHLLILCVGVGISNINSHILHIDTYYQHDRNRKLPMSAVGASDHADKTTRRSRHSKTSKETESSDDNDTPVDVSTYMNMRVEMMTY